MRALTIIGLSLTLLGAGSLAWRDLRKWTTLRALEKKYATVEEFEKAHETIADVESSDLGRRKKAQATWLSFLVIAVGTLLQIIAVSGLLGGSGSEKLPRNETVAPPRSSHTTLPTLTSSTPRADSRTGATFRTAPAIRPRGPR